MSHLSNAGGTHWCDPADSHEACVHDDSYVWYRDRGLGFDEVGVDSLPPSRQATYNHERASKIYLKKIDSERDLDANELFWDR